MDKIFFLCDGEREKCKKEGVIKTEEIADTRPTSAMR